LREPLAQLDTVMGSLAHGPETVRRLTEAYTPGSTWTHAFAEMVQILFADHGLLVVDPTHPALRRAAGPVHARAHAEAAAIASAAGSWSADLEAAGFVAPIHIRPGAPLSFVHPDGPSGPRFRVAPHPDGWQLVGTDRVLPDLGGVAFTTSAMLRPILQDRLLPTAAYVGGPGEIAYFAQLAPVYAAFDLPLPLVVPRPRFVVRDPACDRVLERWGWGLARLSEPRETLLADLAPTEVSLDRWGEARNQLLDALTTTEPAARELSKGLGKSVAKTRRTVSRAVDRLIARYRTALGRDNATSVQRLDRLQAWYTPAGAPQERALSLPTLTARSGWNRLVPTLLAAIRPFDGGLREVPLP
ncbi:MAG: bacillithiol biosynthesis BshC, partial [Myxococcota bacterium]